MHNVKTNSKKQKLPLPRSSFYLGCHWKMPLTFRKSLSAWVKLTGQAPHLVRDPISRDKVGSDAAGHSMSSGLCACTQASTPAQTRCLRPGLHLRDGEFVRLAGSQLPPTIEERISGGCGRYLQSILSWRWKGYFYLENVPTAKRKEASRAWKSLLWEVWSRCVSLIMLRTLLWTMRELRQYRE